ncbi:MAG: hypothetical protein AAB438_01510 [Patescibacteria group bacterium]
MAKEEKALIDFCIENLPFKFKNALQVTNAIIEFRLTSHFVVKTGRPLIQNDMIALGKKVFKKLPPEKKS